MSYQPRVPDRSYYNVSPTICNLKVHQNDYARLTVHLFRLTRQGAAPLESDVTLRQRMLILNPAVQNAPPPVLGTLTQNPAIRSLLANPTLLDHKQPLGSGLADVCHPAVNTITYTLRTYPAVGSTITEVHHPAVIIHTYPAVGILLAMNDITTRHPASDVDIAGAQRAPPLHHTHPPVALLPVEAAAKAGQAAVIVMAVPNTAGGNELDAENTIIAPDGTVSRMVG